jgi:hypothetical protein
MKTRLFNGAVLAFAATAVMAAAGQSKPTAAAKTMVGCIEKAESGSLTLTHAMPADDMRKSSVAKGDMAKDSMARDMMMPAVELSSKKVDLSKHVGHKVSLKGVAGAMMNGMATFTVDSVKMISASCSQ